MKKLLLLCLVLFIATPILAQDPYLGEIRMFAGTFAPRNFAFCDGQLLPIAQNSALFSLLGTTYGGDGRTTFGLPDLRGRVPIHAGNGPGLSPRPQGQKSGVETVTLSVNQIPAHNHTATINADSMVATSDSPNGALLARNAASTPVYSDSTNTTLNGGAVTVSNTGGGQSHNNMQPYLAIRYIIALQGTYPSRP